jgi:hypothetical protein
MDRPILNYAIPGKPVSWKRRYLNPFLILAACYSTLFFIVLLIGVSYADLPAGSTPIFDRFASIVSFPMLKFLYNPLGAGVGALFIVGITNAIIWATTPIALWHAASKILKSAN